MKNRLCASRMLFLMLIVLTAWLPAACTTAPNTGPKSQAQEDGWTTYRHIQSILNKSGHTMDYDTLMQIHQTMVQSPYPIARMDQLLHMLISKRNDDPRIDQMILIFSAKAIGQSRFLIPDAQAVLASILQKRDRVNEWVISFVAEAVQAYAYDLPQGDKLMDEMEAVLKRIRSADRSRQEYFGYHFLPPPKSEFIRAYINGIPEQAVRQFERARYYELIKNNLAEKEIETALRYLQAHGEPDSGAQCPLLMQCLMRHLKRLPFQ